MEKETSIFKTIISKELRPAYYDDFSCIGPECKISCCENWGIAFDKKDYLSLKKFKRSPELSERMEHALRRVKGENSDIIYAQFDMSDGICPLLKENGLCALQLAEGHKALPFVCREFPRRNRYYFTGYLERSLSPACEAVLEQLWTLPNGIEFRLTSLLERDIKNLESESNLTMIRHAKKFRIFASVYYRIVGFRCHRGLY